VRVCASGSVCSEAGGGRQLQVYRPDGALCYTLLTESYPNGHTTDSACEIITYTWTNASGQVVASGSHDSTGVLRIGCTGMDQTVVCSLIGYPQTAEASCPEPAAELATACACATP
jgi:hypothetical protein